MAREAALIGAVLRLLIYCCHDLFRGVMGRHRMFLSLMFLLLAGGAREGTTMEAPAAVSCCGALRDRVFACLPLFVRAREEQLLPGAQTGARTLQDEAHIAHEKRLGCDRSARAAAARRQHRAWLRAQRRASREQTQLIAEAVRGAEDEEAATEGSGVGGPTTCWHMVSFYRLDSSLHSPAELAEALRRAWTPLAIVGRVYVAGEGINAQLAVPDVSLERFKGHVKRHKYLRGVFLNFDEPVESGNQSDSGRRNVPAPFAKLTIKVRPRVLADGLGDRTLDWTNNGQKLSPREFQEALRRSVSKQGNAPIVLDIRNKYESDVGVFAGATLLETDTFRETWERLEHLLRGVPREREVLTYCTGGIRCEKANAYLIQKLGFQRDRVAALQGASARTL